MKKSILFYIVFALVIFFLLQCIQPGNENDSDSHSFSDSYSSSLSSAGFSSSVSSSAFSLVFTPDGNLTPAKNQSVIAALTSINGFQAGYPKYQWCVNSTIEPAGTWTFFTSGDAINQLSGDGNYYLWIWAVDSLGNSEKFVSNAFVLDNRAPADVTDLKATAGDKKVTLSWIPPEDADFIKTEISYNTETIEALKGTNSKEITGLTNLTEYIFSVKTYDALGNLSDGEIVASTPDEPAVITGISPVTGDITGCLTVVIKGSNFARAADVKFGGISATGIKISSSSIECVTPAHAEGDVDVAVLKTSVCTVLKNGYKYINQNIDHIGWANLQWPFNAEIPAGTSVTIYGRVFKQNVTEASGVPAGITAQLGYGPSESDPRNNSDWIWIDAVYNMQYDNNDEFMQDLIINQAGVYVYCYRFSDDGGISYVYGDNNGNTNQSGSTNGFNPIDIGYISLY